MILNDKPNCQVSRILINPRPIFSDRSENDPPLYQCRTNNLTPFPNFSVCIQAGVYRLVYQNKYVYRNNRK
jgi:hypothetical protein